jgi:hypothetical protein
MTPGRGAPMPGETHGQYQQWDNLGVASAGIQLHKPLRQERPDQTS